MTSFSLVKQSGANLADAITRGEWSTAEGALKHLAGAWQRAQLRGADAIEIASMVDGLRRRIVLKHDVDQDVGPEELAWMLAGVSSVLAQAASTVELSGNSVESRILEALVVEPRAMSTKALAERVGHSVAAVARSLTSLREQGLTKATSAGRSVMNAVTDAGRSRNAELVAERNRAEVPTSWPTSIVRGVVAEAAVSMSISDFTSTVVPNDIGAVRRAVG